MSDWTTVLNYGVPFAILVAVGLAAWRTAVFIGRKLFGSEKTGKPGLVDQWVILLANRLTEHELNQKKLGEEAAQRGVRTDEALHLLVDRDAPPTGTAYVAAQAVYRTAVQIEQVQRSMLAALKICRVLARNWPEQEQEINGHCDEIERILREV